MFRAISPSRLLIIGLVFFALVAAGTQLYSWYVKRTTEAALERHDRFLHGLAKKNETRPVEAVNLPTENETPGNTAEKIDEPEMADSIDVLPTGAEPSEFADVGDAFLPGDFLSEAARAEEVPVSPFGFGPYPEIPADYPHLQSWDQISDDGDPEWELMDRVMIKLWTQGTHVIAANMENGLVYPILPDILYLKWDEFEGSDGPVRYISEMIGDPAAAMRLEDIIENKDKDESLSEADLPSDITFIAYSEGAINPHTFLDLPTK